MSDSNRDLWYCYQQTQFLLTQAFSPTLSFAIITAHNPMGQILTSCQNRLLDKQLQLEIDKLHQPYRAVVGTSVAGDHMEKSWAVPIDKVAAIELGKLFNQNAIYFVEAGHLQLVPCLLDYPEQALGVFEARVCLVSELPDIYS
ncbi:DUF3293 domain-containing protein [Shewanella colwelliana]|uniref:DUF3293 domain-containing protein n=1 Tax=Shewanella colwelliana TaxID=23 RepID=UPI00048BBCEE|nr:DUF3293 domain-containing protein [Shewanella colwelliana]